MALIRKILIFTIVFFISCKFVTDPVEVNNHLDYFPIGNKYTWKYKKTTLYFVNDTLENQYLDTLIFSMKIDTTDDNIIFYSYFQDERAIDGYFKSNDTIYSIYHPQTTDTNKFVYWKKNIRNNDAWETYRLSYAGPRFYYTLFHKATDLNVKIKVKNKEYYNCIEIENKYLAISGYNEKCYYAKDVGLIYKEGIRLFLHYRSEYKYELLEFKK